MDAVNRYRKDEHQATAPQNNFGRALRRARGSMLAKELARKSGLHASVLSAFENGHRLPAVSHIERLAVVLDPGNRGLRDELMQAAGYENKEKSEVPGYESPDTIAQPLTASLKEKEKSEVPGYGSPDTIAQPLTASLVEDYLRSEGLRYAREEKRFRLVFKGLKGSIQVHIAVYDDIHELTAWVTLPYRLPSRPDPSVSDGECLRALDQRLKCAEALLQVNWEITLPKLTVDLEDDEVRVECSLECRGSGITEEQLMRYLGAVCTAADTYFDLIPRIRFTGLDPIPAIKSAGDEHRKLRSWKLRQTRLQQTTEAEVNGESDDDDTGDDGPGSSNAFADSEATNEGEGVS